MAAADRGHRRRPLSGRDPHQPHRTATPLELLYDLTFVVAFGQAGNELAHYVAEGHVRTGVVGFAFATFAICWAWISYSWFASAYDQDDWVCRLATMVQMVGVIILALGLPEMFASIEDGPTLDNGVMVLGYIVMRVPMAFQWLRAARHDPARRSAHLTYVWAIVISQIGWTGLVFLSLSVPATFALGFVLLLLELAGPLVAQRRKGGTPWHAHHIAERYALLVIITLGEGVIGTVASLSAVVHGPEGWSVAALYLEHHTTIGAVGTVLSVAVPLAVYVLTLFGLYTLLMRQKDPFHIGLLVGTAAVLVLAVVLAEAGVSMAVCLVVLALAPVVTVVGYETVGHRHQEAALAAMR